MAIYIRECIQCGAAFKNDGGDDLEPQNPGLLFFFLALAQGKGIQFPEEQHDDRQDGAQLDHHIEHGLEFI